MNTKTIIGVTLAVLLSSCACESSFKNPYGQVPSVGLGSGSPAYYGGGISQGVVGQYAVAPQYGPFGFGLSSWGPYGGLNGWGIAPSPGTSGGHGK